jgi:hypothetical protein
MPDVDVDTLAVCLQALEKALKFNALVSASQTVGLRAYAESDLQYERALQTLIRIYKKEERQGKVPVPLKKLLKTRAPGKKPR